MKEREIIDYIVKDEMPDMKRVRENCITQESEQTQVKRGLSLGRRLAPVIIAVVLITTTALAATVLPGLIQSLKVGDITVNQYEPGMLPFNDLPDSDIERLTIENMPFEDSTCDKYTPELVGDVFAKLKFTPLVPTCFDFGEALKSVELWNNKGSNPILSLYYSKAASRIVLSDDYPEEFVDTLLEKNPDAVIEDDPNEAMTARLFTVNQFYIGDAPVNLDTMGEYRSIKINGYDAVINTYNVMWVQDGVLIQLLPVDSYTEEQVIKIAESLVPIK